MVDIREAYLSSFCMECPPILPRPGRAEGLAILGSGKISRGARLRRIKKRAADISLFQTVKERIQQLVCGVEPVRARSVTFPSELLR